MTPFRPLLLLAALSFPAAGAAAEETPLVFPRSDVAVTYAVGGDATLRQTLRVSAARGLQRVDAPGGGMAIITDTIHRTMTVLDERRHVFSVQPASADTADASGHPAPGTYMRLADTTVAGLPCTEWATSDPSGHEVTVCLTADGVLLRARAGGQTLVDAVSVLHETQDPALFAPPRSWPKVDR